MTKTRSPKAEKSSADKGEDAPKKPESVKELLEQRAKSRAKRELDDFLENERLEALPLTAKQHRFVQEYCIDLNGYQAAIRAGYSKKSAASQACEFLKKPNIKKAIKEALEAKAKRNGFDADRLLNLLADYVLADVADLYDDNGHIRPVKAWPMPFRQGLVKKIETNHEYEGTGEDRELVGRITKVELFDRKTQTQLIGKHIGVRAFTDVRNIDDLTPEEDRMKQLRDELSGAGKRISQPAPTGTQRKEKVIEGTVTARTKPQGKQIEG